MVLDAAEQNWLAALKKHTQVKVKKARSHLMAIVI